MPQALIRYLRRRCCTTADLVAVFGGERRPRDQVLQLRRARAGSIRAYLRAQGRLVHRGTDAILKISCVGMTSTLIDVRGPVRLGAPSSQAHSARAVRARPVSASFLVTLSRDDVERFILERSAADLTAQSAARGRAVCELSCAMPMMPGLVRERLDSLDTPRTYRDELPPRALPWPSVLRLLRSIDRASRTAGGTSDPASDRLLRPAPERGRGLAPRVDRLGARTSARLSVARLARP